MVLSLRRTLFEPPLPPLRASRYSLLETFAAPQRFFCAKTCSSLLPFFRQLLENFLKRSALVGGTAQLLGRIVRIVTIVKLYVCLKFSRRRVRSRCLLFVSWRQDTTWSMAIRGCYFTSAELSAGTSFSQRPKNRRGVKLAHLSSCYMSVRYTIPYTSISVMLLFWNNNLSRIYLKTL